MENKHTPGPYNLDFDNIYQNEYGNHELPINAAGLNSIATVVMNNDTPTTEELATGKLLCAAPALLEALRNIIEWLYTPNDDPEIAKLRLGLLSKSTDLRKVITAANSAILKATI